MLNHIQSPHDRAEIQSYLKPTFLPHIPLLQCLDPCSSCTLHAIGQISLLAPEQGIGYVATNWGD